ncbi:MAG: hypothetical protein HYY35_10210 [Deltaproteobacteria bacterium]|nr:hypothetical protein [Deltaproteobacteria bacterium]
MSLAKHLEEAAERLKDAESRIESARGKPSSPEETRRWLAALSDFSLALSDIQRFNNESVHEKLHELAERTGLKRFS